MKVCIINGSPRGKYSVTLQSCLYLQQMFRDSEFKIVNVGTGIKKFEKNMTEPLEAINESDLIVFSYPVYTFIAPSQLHRFIELLKESNIDFNNKFATQITTSKHFYDVTAHRYIEDNCNDMNMKVIHGLSADMDDLLTEKGQNDLVKFFQYVTYCVQNEIHEKKYEVTKNKVPTYKTSFQATEKKDKFDTVIVADIKDNDTDLKAMIDDFIALYRFNVRIVNIAEYPFKGGCLGCFQCAGDGKCIYTDGFDEFLRTNIQKADAIVYAFNICDHSMGARFKMYDDRQVFNGNRTVTEVMAFL